MTTGLDNLGTLLHDATRLLRKRFETRATRYGLSSAQWRLLARVVKSEGASQARLAEVLEIEPISVSRLIDRMVLAGWIERRSDPADRRVRMVYPTDQAREAFGYIKGIAAEVFAEALEGLSESERRTLILALEAINRNLADGEQCCVPGTLPLARSA